MDAAIEVDLNIELLRYEISAFILYTHKVGPLFFIIFQLHSDFKKNKQKTLKVGEENTIKTNEYNRCVCVLSLCVINI